MLILTYQHIILLLMIVVKYNGTQGKSVEDILEPTYEDSNDSVKVDILLQTVNDLAEKVGGLEVNLENSNNNNYKKLDTLTEMVNALAVKIGGLQGEIAAKIKGIEVEIDQKISLLQVEILEKVTGLEVEIQELKKENTFLKTKGAKTCSELKANGLKESGVYDIDPDFSGTTIQVYCDMVTGTTEISHDITDSVDIGYCSEDGCFNQEYSYSAPLNQIEALIWRSSMCEQEIKFDCNIAPLKNSMSGFYYGWWIDRHGERKFYFDGADENRHVCGCYPNCQQSLFHNTCNCDASLIPFWNFDSGKITNKYSLPIKRFVYGGFINRQQKAKITVGKLRCSGLAPRSSDLTSSCSSLKKGGSSVSGFYLTKPSEEANLQVSYCRMDQSGYQEDDLRVGNITDINQRTKMIKIGVTSYIFQNGAHFSHTWKKLIELHVDTSTIEKDLKEFDMELDLRAGIIIFQQSGLYIFTRVNSSTTNRAWQVGSGYNFNRVYYIEKGQKIIIMGHGYIKYFELRIMLLQQFKF